MGWYADKYKEKWTQQSNVTVSEIQAWKNYGVLCIKATKIEFKSHFSTEKCVEDLKIAAQKRKIKQKIHEEVLHLGHNQGFDKEVTPVLSMA